MAHKIIHIDMNLVVTPNLFEGFTFDEPGQLWLYRTTEQTVGGVRRYYYVALPPRLVLVVTRTGEPLDLVKRGDYVRGLVGWDDGDSKFVLPAGAGQRHTKITIDGKLDGGPGDGEATRRSALVEQAPRIEMPGARPVGRPRDPGFAKLVQVRFDSQAQAELVLSALDARERAAVLAEAAQKRRKQTSISLPCDPPARRAGAPPGAGPATNLRRL